MSNKSYFYEPERGAHVLDTCNYFRSNENKTKVGFSLSYGIRNHTDREIHVRGRGGYSQIVEPWDRPTPSPVDQTLEGRDVWIDIKFRISSLRHSHYAKCNHNNGIDETIAKEIDKRVYAAYKVSIDKDEAFECEFSISLSNIIPNFKSNGYHSETLGIIVELSPRAKVVDWLGEVVDQFDEVHNGELKTMLLDIKSCTYQFIHLIDNRGEIGNLWVMQCGSPKLIRGLRNQSVDSGLYIFSNEYSTREKPYVYIPTGEITDKVLREYGIGKTESEVLNSSRTKDYNDLKSEKERVQKSLAEHKTLLGKKDEEIVKLKRDLWISEMKLQREKMTTEDVKAGAKLLGRLDSMIKDHQKVMQKGVDECRKLNDNKGSYSISGVNTAFRMAVETFKAISSILV